MLEARYNHLMNLTISVGMHTKQDLVEINQYLIME